jgi:hypothetical protein
LRLTGTQTDTLPRNLFNFMNKNSDQVECARCGVPQHILNTVCIHIMCVPHRHCRICAIEKLREMIREISREHWTLWEKFERQHDYRPPSNREGKPEARPTRAERELAGLPPEGPQ